MACVRDTHFRDLPIDADSAAVLRERGLVYELIDTADQARFDAWLRADARGFHEGTADPEQLRVARENLGYRRTTAVTDPSAPDPHDPVGTVSSWSASLTTSPGRLVDTWAISSVTVRPTHTGGGIARAMLEGELRTAASAGYPLAALTVSEATLYARYGFAPAAMTADWRIATRRVLWTGPIPDGRVDLITAAQWRDEIGELHDRVRRNEPGHIDAWGLRWDQLAGLTGEDRERSRRLQAARYVDQNGMTRGLMLFRVAGNDDDFADSALTIDNLTTETHDAYAALWRLAVTMPLVGTVAAPMRRLDEPVRWMIADWRAAQLSPRDNLWLRILDVPRALQSRRFQGPGRVRLDVSDALGHAAGSYLLVIDSEGNAAVETGGAISDQVTRLTLGIAELSAILLGGVPVATLVAAGRVTATQTDAAAASALFTPATEPWLPFWF